MTSTRKNTLRLCVFQNMNININKRNLHTKRKKHFSPDISQIRLLILINQYVFRNWFRQCLEKSMMCDAESQILISPLFILQSFFENDALFFRKAIITFSGVVKYAKIKALNTLHTRTLCPHCPPKKKTFKDSFVKSTSNCQCASHSQYKRRKR